MFYKHETGVLFVEGFAEKFLFLSFQTQSWTLPLTLLRQTADDCSVQVRPTFSEVLSAVFMWIQLPGNRVFNQSHCLSKVCVPAKEEQLFSWASSQVLHKLTAVVGKVLPFEAFFWHLLFGSSFQALQPSA